MHWQTSNDLVVLASMSSDVQELIRQVLAGRIKPAEMAARQAAAASDGAATP